MSQQEIDSSKISHGLRMMFNLEDLLKSNIVCDFLINIGEASFPTHKAVLAACSNYFRTMLAEGIDQGVVYINGVEPEAMEQCIKFMYSGEANITLNNVESVLNAAELFKIDELVDLCFAYLKRNITVENCLDMRNIVAAFESLRFRESVDKFVVSNMNDVVETTAFKELMKQDMKYYLKMWRIKQRSASAPQKEKQSTTRSPRIFLSARRKTRTSASSEPIRPASSATIIAREKMTNLVMWKGVLSWISYDPGDRNSEFLELLKFIKFTKYGVNFLASTAWNETLVSENKSVKDLIASKVLSHIGELKAGMNLENCLNIYRMVTNYCQDDFDRLLKVVVAFIASNLRSIRRRSEIGQWCKDELCLFFTTCNRPTVDESDMWETALTWLKYDKERNEDALDILKALDIKSFSPTFVVANVLKEPGVKESKECVKYLESVLFKDYKLLIWNTNLSTCFTLKYLSRKYKDTIYARIENDLLSFIITNFLQVVEQPEFMKLSFDELMRLCKILRKRNIHGEAKWKAIIKWVKYDPDLRRRHLPALLQTINFERLTPDFLKTNVQKEKLVATSLECNEIVMTAIFNKLT